MAPHSGLARGEGLDELQHDCGFREVLEAAHDMILVKGPGSRLLWANKSFRDYYGMSESELINIIDGPQSDPDDTLQYVRDDQMVFDTGDHVDIASEAVTDADGVVRHFHTIKSPIMRDGVTVSSVGICRLLEDTLDSGLSHLDAKAMVKPLRLLTSAFPLAIVLTDVLGRVVSVSPLWNEMFGDADNSSELFVDRYGELLGLGRLLSDAYLNGASSTELIQVPRESGLLALDVRIGPWNYDDGTLGGAMILATDVTKDVEHQMELERTIERRLAAEQALMLINEDLEHFVHVAAHDLREPARRQLMLTDLLVDEHGDQLGDEVRAQLDRLCEQSRKMLEMVDGFRHLSGITGPVLERAEIDLLAMFDGIVAEFDTADLEDVSIQADLPAHLTGYPVLVRALVQNLLENALVHGPRPLDIQFGHTVAADGTIEFSASNNWTGTPLDADAAMQLFKPFVQAESDAVGSGLGMSICKRVVERHHGTIWLDVTDRFDVHFTLGEQT